MAYTMPPSMTTPTITAWTNSYGTATWLITFVSTLLVSKLNMNSLQVLNPKSKTLQTLSSSSKKKKWMRYLKALASSLLKLRSIAWGTSPSLVSKANAMTLSSAKTIRIRIRRETMIISAIEKASTMMLMKFALMKTIFPSLTLSTSS